MATTLLAYAILIAIVLWGLAVILRLVLAVKNVVKR